MNERIQEVSVTISAALERDDVEGMNEAERLALIVGAAYGNALAERDQARADLGTVGDALAALAAAASDVLGRDFMARGSLTWAHDEVAVERLREHLESAYQALESVQAPETPEGGTNAAHV